MKRLGTPLRAVALTLAVLGGTALGGAPATAATTVHVTGVVTVGGQPVQGAVVSLGATAVASDATGGYAAEVPVGSTELTLDVTTPHEVRGTTARYHGFVDVTGDLVLDLPVPGDRATTMALTEADGTTPVARAEYDLFLEPTLKLDPAVGPFDWVSDVETGSDDAVTDDAGRATFYVPDLSGTSYRQTGTLTAYDPHYTRPDVSTQIAYPATPAAIALAFPGAQPPSAPRDLAVSSLTPTGATFAWSAPASEGSGYLDSYVVSYGPTGARPTVVTVPATSSTGGRLQVTDLEPGGGYSVDVRAVSAAGSSPAVFTSFATPKYAVQARVLSVSPVQPVSGQAATVSVGVTGGDTAYPVTGEVRLYDDGVEVGAATLTNGRATVVRPFLAGSHSLTVGYSGDATHLPTSAGSGPTTTLTVAKAASTTSVTAGVSGGKGQSRDVTLGIDVRALAPGSGTPTGSVTVRDSVSGTTRTLTLSNGTVGTTYLKLRAKRTVTFTVTYLGGPEHDPSTASLSVKL